MSDLNQRFMNLTDEELVEQIKIYFGDEAACKLQQTGYLTISEAFKYAKPHVIETGVVTDEAYDILFGLNYGVTSCGFVLKGSDEYVANVEEWITNFEERA